MTIHTALSCGDKAWAVFVAQKRIQELTIGQVRVEYTDSKGVNGGRINDKYPDIAFDNYKPKHGVEEVYMCVETGIGSGSLYHFGKHIFQTQEQAEQALEKAMAEA